MNNVLFNAITQDVAITMMSMKIIEQPAMNFFDDDSGVFYGVFLKHTTNQRILQLKLMGEDTYATACGMHAFGAGVCATLMQSEVDKPIDQWEAAEIQSIAVDFAMTDSYELALNKLGIPLTETNKQVLDAVILNGLESAKKHSNSEVLTKEELRAYMQVMFNAGITLVMQI